MAIAISKNYIPIRLSDERWLHITTGHPEMADYYYDILEAIENPDIIYSGNNDAKLAIKMVQERNDKFVVVVYKEISDTDGFVITAYFSSMHQQLNKAIIWKQHN